MAIPISSIFDALKKIKDIKTDLEQIEKYKGENPKVQKIVDEAMKTHKRINVLNAIAKELEKDAYKNKQKIIDTNQQLVVVKEIFNKKMQKLEKMQKTHCNTCKKNNLDVALKICSQCKKIRYCSIECQKKDWDNHKKICPTTSK